MKSLTSLGLASMADGRPPPDHVEKFAAFIDLVIVAKRRRDVPIDPNEFAAQFPVLCHVSLSNGLKAIERHGLLSTTALLDLFGIQGERRKELEGRRRPQRELLTHPRHGKVWLNDQIPLQEANLERCLDGMTVEEWMRELNRRVFFWPTLKRLKTHLDAGRKRGYRQLVLEADTAELLHLYGAAVELSPINSGSAIRKASSRGRHTFLPLNEYPFHERRKRCGLAKAVAEVTVRYAVTQAGLFRKFSI
jgi:hypothetical protein